MNKTENPAAFPWANDADKQYNWIQWGMSLRDYFAAKAMQGLLSDGVGKNADIRIIASDAYFVADEMLKAREA